MTNIQGEDQQKLDLYANDVFKAALINREIVCGIASEEEEDFMTIEGRAKFTHAEQICCIDRPIRRIFKYRCECISRNHFLYL